MLYNAKNTIDLDLPIVAFDRNGNLIHNVVEIDDVTGEVTIIDEDRLTYSTYRLPLPIRIRPARIWAAVSWPTAEVDIEILLNPIQVRGFL